MTDTMTMNTSEQVEICTGRELRIWADGCYDMSHFGHANSLRQAKALGQYLTVGVHSDEDISANKGTPPVFNEQERYEMVRAIKWVDKVVEAAPYQTTLETLAEHRCDFCAHGNDITTTADGIDTYQMVKYAGKYKEVERTQGVSTTDLINRMLEIVRYENEDSSDNDPNNNPLKSIRNEGNFKDIQPSSVSPWTGNSTPLLLTTKKIREFCTNDGPLKTDKIVYVAGAFDIFHMGHLKFLKKAASLGEYLIVGVHSDATVNAYCGSKYPIMTVNERVLNLLGCKYVQEVVIDAPFIITDELLTHLNVSVVAHGKMTVGRHPKIEESPYDVPRQKNILIEIDSESTLTCEDIVDRIRVRKEEYEERNRKKEEKEAHSYAALQEINRQIHQ